LLCPSCGADAGDISKFCPACGCTLVRAAEADEYIGKLIARKYRVEALIGEGGMGKVYRATQTALDKPVVLKVLRQSLLSDERTVARFQREAKAASRLNHPNSISVLDFGQADDGALFIAMELVSGRDLHQIISREWPLPEARIIRLVSQVLSALQDAHAAGVIHRDLKPENIMVEPRRGGETDFVKVLDFGIAKIQDGGPEEGPALTRAGFVCGTPEYMSPEQARGALLDARSDLYAVGVILYQLSTGLLPFESDSAVGFATKHLTEEPPAPSKRRPDARISPPMERLILKALSKSPDDRPQTAESFKAELVGVAKENRRANHAARRGVSSPVLAPIPSRGASGEWKDRTEANAPSPWEKPDETVRSSPPTAAIRASQAQPPVPGPSPALATATVNAAPPLAKDATPPIEAPSMLPFKIITLLLVGITVALGGYYLYQLYFSTYDSEPIPKNAPVPINSQGAAVPAGALEPLYQRHTPREQWNVEDADKLARAATERYAHGDWGMAATKLKDAYERAQEPVYALKLGAILRVHGAAGEREARNWWQRYLTDVPDSPARAQILALYPDLAGAARQ
jgi:serine/threonine-protein kinase